MAESFFKGVSVGADSVFTLIIMNYLKILKVLVV